MTWVVFTEGRLRQRRGEGENQYTNEGSYGLGWRLGAECPLWDKLRLEIWCEQGCWEQHEVCVSMCVCVNICIHVYVYVCMFMYVCIYAEACVWLHVYMCYVYSHVCACMHVCMCVHASVCVFACVCV